MTAPVNVVKQGPDAIVDWNPEPTKQVVKAVYEYGLTVLTSTMKAPVKVLTATCYGPVNDAAVDLGANAVNAIAKKGTDALANACYETPTSLGSRVAKWYGYPG